ncbi:MAG: tyrosine-type recombinase/integrase [bacterium]
MEFTAIRTLITEFIQHLSSQGKSSFTLIAYKKDLEQFVGFLSSLEKSDVREIKKEDIDGFIAKLIKDGYTKKSASRKLNSIRTFFRFLKNSQKIDQNPALDVSHPKYSQTPPRILSKLEYHALRDFAKEDPRTYALIEVLLQTGIKIGELAGLKLGDVTESGLHIKSYGKTPIRELPLNKSAKKAISEYLKVRESGNPEDPLFITRSRKAILIRNIRQIINRCFREVEIQKATVNDLRNTFIAQQIASGISLEYIAKIVGHRRLSSTERFLNLVKEETQKKEQLGEL